MTTAARWQRNEIARLTEAFTKSGKAKRVYEPSRDIFVSDAEYELALTMRVKLCDKPQHQGDRVMICNHTNFYYEKGAPVHCKPCKMGNSRQLTATKRKERMVVYATADDWFQSVAHDTTRDGETIGTCRMPLKDEFTNEDEYEKALSMRDERYQEFQRQFHARPDVRDKDNAYHRAEYANMSAEMKTEKMDRDQANKDARKETALQSGMCWCSFGSHAVPSTSMYGNKCVQNACKSHFLEWYRQTSLVRGKTVALTHTQVEELVTSPCEYCHHLPTEKANGIDLMDAMCTEYKVENCVPCCTGCNLSKGGLLAHSYIQKCKDITTFQNNKLHRATSYIPWRQIHGSKTDDRAEVYYQHALSYARYKESAMRKGRDFAISMDEVNALKLQGCTYCGLMHAKAIGMDRIDNTRGYTIDNVCGCCISCNMMKRSTSTVEFLQRCARVASFN